MIIQVVFYHDRKPIGTIQAESLAYARRMGRGWVQTETDHKPTEELIVYPRGTEHNLRSGYSSRTVTISRFN